MLIKKFFDLLKKFMEDRSTLGTNVIKLFTNFCNKLECLYLTDLSSLV
jgi:hypothetical protein